MDLKMDVYVCFLQNYLGLIDADDVVEELRIETDQMKIDEWIKEKVAEGKEAGYIPEENPDDFLGNHDFELTMTKGDVADGYTSYGIVCRKFVVGLDSSKGRRAAMVERMIGVPAKTKYAMGMRQKKFGPAPACLEDILVKCFGCKKPFLKNPKELRSEKDGETQNEYFTAKGGKAYGLLAEVIYGLGIMGLINDADEIVEELDSIVRQS